MIHVFVWSDPFEFSGQVVLGGERSTEVCYDFYVSVLKTKPCQQLTRRLLFCSFDHGFSDMNSKLKCVLQITTYNTSEPQAVNVGVVNDSPSNPLPK